MNRAEKAALHDGGVQVSEQLFCPGSLHSNDDPVRMQKVFNGRALSEKLGVGGDLAFGHAAVIMSEGSCDPSARLHRYGALLDDKFIVSRCLGDPTRHLLYC